MNEEELYYKLSIGEITIKDYLKIIDKMYTPRWKIIEERIKERQSLKEMSHSEFFKLVSDRSNIPIGTIKAVIDSINNTYESIKDEYKVTLPLIISVR